MKNLSIVLLAALSVAACKKAGGASECASVMPPAVDRIMPDLKKENAGIPEDKLATFATSMKSVLVKRCTEDKWSAEYLKCVSNGKTADDMQKCDKTLPKDQKDKLDKDLEDAMKPMMADMMKHADSPSEPPAGDMAGSAAPAPAPEMAGSAAAPSAGSAKP